MRLDIFLTEQKLAETRNKASLLIQEGKVLVNGQVARKPSQHVTTKDSITLTQTTSFVGRGGYKLEHALHTFNIDVENKVALDIGSSTGGFTDCLLRHNIKKVYAVDVGTDQLHETLRNNKKVNLFEQTDIRKFQIEEKVDLVVCDVSFISIQKIIPLLSHFLKQRGICVLLIKPQFELGKNTLNKKGVVKDKSQYDQLVLDIAKLLKEENFAEIRSIASPITGGDGNEEFLISGRLVL